SAAGLETAERPAAAPCSGGPFRMSVTGVAPQPPRDTGTPTHTTAAPIRCRTGAAVLASQRVRTPPRGVHATHAPPESFSRSAASCSSLASVPPLWAGCSDDVDVDEEVEPPPEV